MPTRPVQVAITIGLVLALPACARSQSGEEQKSMDAEQNAKLAPELRRLVAQPRDTVIGLLVRTDTAVDDARRAALDATGLTVGTVTGTVVTGRARVQDVPELAQLPFVTYMELARTIPVPSPPADVAPDTAADPAPDH